MPRPKRPSFEPRLAQRRQQRGLTQEDVAGLLGISVEMVRRHERGQAFPADKTRQKYVRVYGAQESELWIGAAGPSPAARVSGGPGDMPKVTPRVPSRNVDHADVGASDSFTAAIRSFRAADKNVGGGHLYPAVVKYLQGEVAPRLFGLAGDTSGQELFTAAAALTDMAGWMAHDAGCDPVAERHFARSWDLVQVGKDRQLGVHVLASMSHLSHYCGKVADAIDFARRGQDVLSRGAQQPELEARLLAMQARGFATLNRGNDCIRLLLEAERKLALAPGDGMRSLWVSHFDEGSLAGEAARCFHQIGDGAEAQRQAERVIELRSGDRTRSRALGQLTLVAVLIAQGRPDEACNIAQIVLDTTRQLGSYPVLRQFSEIRQLLEPVRSSRNVAQFISRLDETLREREWFYRRSAREGHGGIDGSRGGSEE